MKNKVLILGAIIGAFTFSAYAGAGAAAQLKSQTASQPAADTTIASVIYVNSATPLTPRTQSNQSKIVQGSSEGNYASDCRRNMVTSPKACGECAQHANMPGCMTIAPLK